MANDEIAMFVYLNAKEIDQMGNDVPELKDALMSVVLELGKKYPDQIKPSKVKPQTDPEPKTDPKSKTGNWDLPWKTKADALALFGQTKEVARKEILNRSRGEFTSALETALKKNVLIRIKNPGAKASVICKIDAILPIKRMRLKEPKRAVYAVQAAFKVKLYSQQYNKNYYLFVFDAPSTPTFESEQELLDIFTNDENGNLPIYNIVDTANGEGYKQTTFKIKDVVTTAAWKAVRKVLKPASKKSAPKKASPKVAPKKTAPSGSAKDKLSKRVMTVIKPGRKAVFNYIYDVDNVKDGINVLFYDTSESGKSKQQFFPQSQVEKLIDGQSVKTPVGTSYMVLNPDGTVPAMAFPEQYEEHILKDNEGKRQGPDMSARQMAEHLKRQNFKDEAIYKSGKMKVPPFVVTGNNGNFWYLTKTNKGAYRWTEAKSKYGRSYLNNIFKNR